MMDGANMSRIIGVYPGSFDPITNGHLDIIKRSLKFCDHLIIAIGFNPTKKFLFTETERLQQIYQVIDNPNISVKSFPGLLVDFAKEQQASIMIRGIRSVSDFEYEITLANVNKVLLPEVETVFLPTSPELAVVSSSMVKEIAKHGGAIEQFVPAAVAQALRNKF